jgi:hypothetical protein
MRCLFITVAALATLGCQGQAALPSVEASSPHFHYFATSADHIPEGILDRLEQHRADVLDYLGFSDDRVINYYLFDQIADLQHVECGGTAQACSTGGNVFTTGVFDQHELTLAYLSSWLPAFVIAEGAAEAFHCGDILRAWDFAVPSNMDWTAVVGQAPPNADVYRWGVRLVLHLLRTYGPARFLKYYQSTHTTNDPALFALEFERFWGVSIDEVWAVLTADLGSVPLPICPCGAPTVQTDGTSMSLSAFDDYRVLPPAQDGQTLLMQLVGVAPKLTRCAGGSAMPMRGVDATGAPYIQPAIAAIMTDQDRYFVSFDGAGSVTGQWQTLIQPDCSAAGVLPVSLQTDYVAVGVPRRTDGPAWYIKLSFTGQATTSRDDDGPIVLNSCSDCNSSCISQSQYTMLVFQERTLVLTLPQSATDTNVGVAIIQQWYTGSP